MIITALTMIDNGEAYIVTLKSMHIVPTMAERLLTVWTIVNETNARRVMKISSKMKARKSLSLLLRSE